MGRAVETDWVVTPLNAVSYNSRKHNLRKHGLHNRLTHVCVNFPLLFGPTVSISHLSHSIAHARLTFLFLQSGAVFLRRRRAERLASDEKSVLEKAGTVKESF